MEKKEIVNGGQQKHIFHLLGREYKILSKLDEATFARVSGLVREQVNALPPGVKQDEKMILVCLQLAYTLDMISGKCGAFLDKNE